MRKKTTIFFSNKNQHIEICNWYFEKGYNKDDDNERTNKKKMCDVEEKIQGNNKNLKIVIKRVSTCKLSQSQILKRRLLENSFLNFFPSADFFLVEIKRNWGKKRNFVKISH